MGKSRFFRQKFHTDGNVPKHKAQNIKPSTSNSDDFFVNPSESTKPDTQQDNQPKKKPFNKSKWRTQKYSQKSKIEAWKDKRKDYFLHGYRKEKNRQKDTTFDVQKIYEEEERRAKEQGEEPSFEVKQQRKPFKNMAERIREKKEEKEKRRTEFLQKRAEREETVKKYKKEQIERHKKLNKKTKKGQPVMKGRIEYLLEKIQKTVGIESCNN